MRHHSGDNPNHSTAYGAGLYQLTCHAFFLASGALGVEEALQVGHRAACKVQGKRTAH